MEIAPVGVVAESGHNILYFLLSATTTRIRDDDDVLNPLLVLRPRHSSDRRTPPRRADLPEVNVVAVGAARVACNGYNEVLQL